MTVPMRVPVVILQTAGVTRDLSAALERQSIKCPDEFYPTSSVTVVEDLIYGGSPQLLITGTIHGDEQEAVELAQRLKQVNPELVVWFYSTFAPVVGVYDKVIARPLLGQSRSDVLAEEVRKYLGR